MRFPFVDRARTHPASLRARAARRALLALLTPCAAAASACRPPRSPLAEPGHVAPRVFSATTGSCAVAADGGAYCWGFEGHVEGTVMRVADSLGRPIRLATLDAGVWKECGRGADGRTYCTWEMAGRGRTPTDTMRTACDTLICVYPVATPRGRPFVAVSAGYYHACGLTADGRAFCWGTNGMGQLGLGWRAPDSTGSSGAKVRDPAPVAGGLRFRQLSAGEMFTCGIVADGRTYCWGYGQSGALGRDTVMTDCSGALPQPNAPCSVDRPVEVVTTQRFHGVDAGNRLACAISADSAAYCWGSNYRCALGRCGSPDSPHPTRIAVPGRVVQVDAGYWFACAVTSDARAYCWGNNTSGQLGSSATADSTQCFLGGGCSPTPVEVGGEHRWSAVSAADDFACGVTVEGEVLCWGARRHGSLGLGASSEVCENHSKSWPDGPCSTTPVRVRGVPRLTAGPRP